MAAGSDYFSGRRIWITGASTGIGAACVREFVRRGARVAASARNRQAHESLVAELGSWMATSSVGDTINVCKRAA